MLGARLIDRDNFLETAENFRDRYQGMSVQDLLSDTIDLEGVRYSGGTELREATARVRAVQHDINQLSNKPLRVSGSYGVAFGYPAGLWSWGGYHRHYIVLGSAVRVADEDNASIDRVTGMIDRFAEMMSGVISSGVKRLRIICVNLYLANSSHPLKVGARRLLSRP